MLRPCARPATAGHQAEPRGVLEHELRLRPPLLVISNNPGGDDGINRAAADVDQRLAVHECRKRSMSSAAENAARMKRGPGSSSQRVQASWISASGIRKLRTESVHGLGQDPMEELHRLMIPA